ncbi:DDE-type integrase/transposase/recombinase [Streptomyces sp. NPDC052236]|uniref:DDE-type integrase/transposase/recombinase n=1 Tax=Streptomyces sp. NPDC052236 TaxID=3365686 RepID=UPI0037D80558
MKLVGDIIYIATGEGRLYLATWLDLATREIVGYSMADHHASLVVGALRMGAGRGRLQPGYIAHSDHGSEDTSDEHRCEIGWLGLRQSMVRTGSCFDNAAAESFFALLKEEIGTRQRPTGSAPARRSSPSSRPSYNRKRLRRHPVRGYLTPLRPDSDTSKDTPSQRKHRVSKITGELHCRGFTSTYCAVLSIPPGASVTPSRRSSRFEREA